MIKKLLTLILIINGIYGFSQSDFEILKETDFDKYYISSYFKSFYTNDTIELISRIQEKNSNSVKLSVAKFTDSIFISERVINNKDFIAFKDIFKSQDNYIITGTIYPDNSETEQDYIGAYNIQGFEIWNLLLDKKYEGIYNAKIIDKKIQIISSGLDGLNSYIISNEGKLVNRSKLPQNGFPLISNFIDNDVLIISVKLNSNGETEKWIIDWFDKDFNLKLQSAPEFEKRFFPIKILSYNDKILIVGNLDNNNGFIPIVYIFDKELHLLQQSELHYQPDNYKFKNDFRINDIKLINEKIFCAGTTKIREIETNIIFELKDYKIFKYSLLDKSAGIWNSCGLLDLNNDKLIFIGDTEKSDYESIIKMIKIEKK
ncbi:hypothetical protein ACT3CD_10430 [Geofilum sp. OHC36d9]|uniref:hypothetical protein n=1 Tax=Geofilum sp. OHC36d9 TaxID=3458413 RepID=UPI0040336220